MTTSTITAESRSITIETSMAKLPVSIQCQAGPSIEVASSPRLPSFTTAASASTKGISRASTATG